MKKKNVLFHQDNALCHKSIAMMAKVDELHFELLQQLMCYTKRIGH